MKDEAEVITRKAHDCSFCGEVIPKGSKALFYEGKTGRFDENDNQIGVEFYKNWLHNYRCHLAPEERVKCDSGNHKFEPEYESDGWNYSEPTGFNFCTVCGIKDY